MVRTFHDKDTAVIANGRRVARFQTIQQRAVRRLEMVLDPTSLQDLQTPRSNRLESLCGDRQGQYSVRINDQWRICFEWSEQEGRAVNIEIVDYR